MLRAAAKTGWQAVRQVRFQRNVHSSQPFATAWHLKLNLSQSEQTLEPETIFWQDHDGSPSKAWWQLVGSLYYWHLRPKKKQFGRHNDQLAVSVAFNLNSKTPPCDDINVAQVTTSPGVFYSKETGRIVMTEIVRSAPFRCKHVLC